MLTGRYETKTATPGARSIASRGSRRCRRGYDVWTLQERFRDIPESVRVRRVEGVGGDAGPLGVPVVDGRGFVAVVEVAPADPYEVRRRREQHGGGRALLGRLLALGRRDELAADVPLQAGGDRTRV